MSTSGTGSEPPCKSEAELDLLGDEQLLAYVIEMREAGRDDCLRAAFGVLAFGYWDFVASLVSKKANPRDIEDLTAVVIESALRSAFDGKTIGEFVNWLKTITARRIADFYRTREGRPSAEPLPSEHAGDDTIFANEPVSEEEGYAAIEIREAAGRVLAGRKEIHQLVIRLTAPPELGWGEDLPAAEVAERVTDTHPGAGMTDANVYQIWKRFKTDLDKELGLGGS